MGLLFVSPWIIGFTVFTLYPFVMSIYLSLTKYSVLAPAEFIGLDNYRTLFGDNLFWTSLYNTFYFCAFSVPLGAIIGVLLALLLNQNVGGMAVYRTVYYLPSIVPIVASSIVWMWLFNPYYGVINALLELVGIQGPGWIADPAWSKPALIIMSLWGVGNATLIYLASLQDVPVSLYESAELDGASAWHKTIHITIPMITPTILFNVIMGLINSFQYFTQAYIMTNGGPADSTLFYSLYLYNNSFRYFKMGYASAQAWILFVIIMFFTLLLLRSSRSWVYYAGER
ncbi:MAG: sugar ABC transporter permease [Firmicutes bacterium]|nr:sugar ABC transporter permease [Bacillota bacterium]